MKIYFLYFFLLTYGLIGCSQKMNSSTENDETGNDSIRFERFDKDLYNYLNAPSSNSFDSIKAKYPEFLPAFGYITIKDSNADSIVFNEKLIQYFSNDMLKQIYGEALNTFDNMSIYEAELTKANDIIKERFESKKLPRIGTHVSGFKENVVVLDDYLSISIDKYLGKDNSFYLRFFEDFKRIQMQPQFMTRDILRAWIASELISAQQTNLRDNIINEGRILYILSVLLPEREKNDLLGYTQQQADWCDSNEKNIWKVIIENNYLFSNTPLLIAKFMNEAPYTAPISPESPGRIGAWTGYRIVESYMQHSNVPLDKLISIEAQTILKESKYNPQS